MFRTLSAYMNSIEIILFSIFFRVSLRYMMPYFITHYTSNTTGSCSDFNKPLLTANLLTNYSLYSGGKTPSMPEFNDRLKQLLLIGIIGALVLMLLLSLKNFIPGILGAVTLYILSREKYFQLIYHYKWRKGWTAGIFILFYLIFTHGTIHTTKVAAAKQAHPQCFELTVIYIR